MSEFTTLFRHCPSCGRRFEVRLVTRRLLDERKTVVDERLRDVQLLRGGEGRHYITVEDSKPTVVDIKRFQFSYKCKHCGHRWSEERSTYS